MSPVLCTRAFFDERAFMTTLCPLEMEFIQNFGDQNFEHCFLTSNILYNVYTTNVADVCFKGFIYHLK